MPKYRVNLQMVLSTSVEVTADNEEAARDAAFDSDAMPGRICAQCSGWGSSWYVDEGEWDVLDGDDAVELVEG
jgi:hypothetical protein